jgi:hypothetical protein
VTISSRSELPINDPHHPDPRHKGTMTSWRHLQLADTDAEKLHEKHRHLSPA